MAGRYDWKKGIPPVLDEHSAAKHRVLRRYVENYIQILCQNPRREQLRLVVVDGFCGGGVFQDESGLFRPGSPLILQEALRCGRALVRTRRSEMGMAKAFDLKATLVLNDIDPAAIAMLKDELGRQPEAEWVPDTHITTLPFETLAHQLIEKYRPGGKSPRILFVLDQYGMADASLPVMRALFAAFPKAEIFLTFSIDALVNFASPNTIANYKAMLAKMGFDEAVSAEQLAQLKVENDGAKHLIQTVILREVFPQTGASYATPFFIVPRQSRRGYWLLHLANSARANDEMKALHWQEHNTFRHYGNEGLNILAFDPVRLDAEAQFAFDFGDSARERTQDALREDLLRRVGDRHVNGTTVGELLESVANETPATRDMVCQALFGLGEDRALDVHTVHGRQRKSVDRLALEDEVRLRRQLTFF